MYCLLNRLKPLLSQLFPTEIWITSFQSKFTNKTFSKKQRKVCMRWMKWCNNPTHIHTNTEKGIPLQILVGFSKYLPSWSSRVFPCSAPSKSSILFSRGWRCLFSIRQKRFFSSSHKLNPSKHRPRLPTYLLTTERSSARRDSEDLHSPKMLNHRAAYVEKCGCGASLLLRTVFQYSVDAARLVFAKGDEVKTFNDGFLEQTTCSICFKKSFTPKEFKILDAVA